MALFDKGDKVKRWKYRPRFLKIITPNKKDIEIPVERISVLYIEENYEEHYYPIISIKLIIDSDMYYDILERKNECKVYLRIDKFHFINNTDNTHMSVPKNFINDTFELILDESTEDLYKSVKEDENKTDYTKRVKDITNDLNKVRNEITFYLFKSNINNTKVNINKILVDCNVSDAIAYIATVTKLNDIIMAQPDNNKIYKELLLPPLSVVKTLEFIDLYYGIYKQGTMIYFGVNATYIIPHTGKCVVYEPGEKFVTNIIIPKITNLNHDNTLGTLDKKNDKTKNYIVADPITINIQNQSISNDYINANNIEAVDTYENIKTTSESDAITKESNFTKIVENSTMNEYFAYIYTNQTRSKSVLVTLRIKDFDIGAISPNKEYNLIFEDPNYTKKYNGEYFIAGITQSYIKEGEYLSLDAVIVLRKMD